MGGKADVTYFGLGCCTNTAELAATQKKVIGKDRQNCVLVESKVMWLIQRGIRWETPIAFEFAFHFLSISYYPLNHAHAMHFMVFYMVCSATLSYLDLQLIVTLFF